MKRDHSGDVVKKALLCLMLVLAGSAAQAAPAKPPADLDAMRAAFAAAVTHKDRAAMAKLSAFPLAVDVYGSAPTVTEKQFVSSNDYVSGWFFDGDAQVSDCIGKGPLAFQSDQKEFGAGSWYADCNGNEYYFGQRNGHWLFTAYQNINE